MSAPLDVDAQMAEQEAKIRAKYGDALPTAPGGARRAMLAKKLSNKKKNFDSADWALSKKGSAVVSESQPVIPVTPDLPHAQSANNPQPTANVSAHS